jgi:inorganic pyrophosphatase
VISERPISKSEIVLDARVVGGIRMIDRDEADDKIVAILQNDSFWGDITDIADLPTALIDRLRHYFGTYKLVPGQEAQFSVRETYGLPDALRVVEAAMEDYEHEYGQ